MLIAGPCGVESIEQAYKIAKAVQAAGATHFRAGCWKGQNKHIINGRPEWAGLGISAANILEEINWSMGIKCIADVHSVEHAQELIKRELDFIQVGARHMQNLPLLNFLRDQDQVVILKRGLGNTIEEWLGSAERLGGPEKVILCERGIVSFDRTTETRWRLDMVGVAWIKHYTDYRIIVDPSHGSGDRNLVLPLAKAALQIADGLMIEVHYNPDESPTDAKQTVDVETFRKIAEEYKKVFGGKNGK